MADIRPVTVTVKFDDISTAETVCIPVTDNLVGKITQVKTCIAGAISNSNVNGSIVVFKNTTVLGTITIQGSGSAAGDIDTLNLTSPTAGYLKVGDYIKIVNSGDSTTAASGMLLIDIVR